MIPGSTPSRIIRFQDMQSLVATAVKTGAATITANKEILTVYSPSLQDAAWALIPVYAPRGTVIEVSCEARQDTITSQGRFSIDQYPTDDKVAGNDVDYITMEGTSWRPYKLIFAGDHKNPYATATFGLNKASIGRAHYRNITVTMYNISSPSPDYRACMIRGDEGKWTIDDGPNRFTNIGCYKIQLVENNIRIFYEPMQAWGRPIATAQIDLINGSRKYVITCASVEKGSTDIMIVDSTTGTVMNPRNLKSGSSWIGFTAIAI